MKILISLTERTNRVNKVCRIWFRKVIYLHANAGKWTEMDDAKGWLLQQRDQKTREYLYAEEKNFCG